jgi:hypothetical protein
MSSRGDMPANEWPGIEANYPATDVKIAPAGQSLDLGIKVATLAEAIDWPAARPKPSQASRRPGRHSQAEGTEMGEEPSGSQTSRSGLHIGKHPRCFGHRTSVEERLTGRLRLVIETYRAEGECEVDSGRPAGLSTGGFPRVASRTRRAGRPGTGLSTSPVTY